MITILLARYILFPVWLKLLLFIIYYLSIQKTYHFHFDSIVAECMYSQKAPLPIWRNYPLDKAHIPNSEDLIQLKQIKSEILSLKKQIENRSININISSIENQLVTLISTFKECYASKTLIFEKPLSTSIDKKSTIDSLKETKNTTNNLLEISYLTEKRALNTSVAEGKTTFNHQIQEYIDDTLNQKFSENENRQILLERKLHEQSLHIRNLENSLMLQDKEIKNLRSDIDNLLQKKELPSKMDKIAVKTKPRFRFFSSGYDKLN